MSPTVLLARLVSFIVLLIDGTKIPKSSPQHFVEKFAWMHVYGHENVKYNVAV